MNQETQTIWEDLKKIRWFSKPTWLVRLKDFGFTDQDILEVQEEEEDFNNYISLVEKEYENSIINVKIQMNEFKKEFPIEWQNQMKITYLKPIEKALEDKFIEENKYYVHLIERDIPYWFRSMVSSRIEQMGRQYEKVKTHIRFLQNYEKLKNNQITPDQIAKAKEYPLNTLVQANRNGFALCPFHSDKNPSMYIKNNFYHCFVCKESGDVIDFVQKRDNRTFSEAIKLLI